MKKVNFVRSFSFAFLFGCMIFLFSFPLSAQDQSLSQFDFSKSVFIAQPKVQSLSPEETLWVPGNVKDAIKKNVQSKLKMKVMLENFDSTYEIHSTIRNNNGKFSVSVDFVNLASSQILLTLTSPEYSNPASLYIKNGGVDTVFNEFVTMTKESGSKKNSSVSSKQRSVYAYPSEGSKNEFIVGAGPMFVFENSDYDSSKYSSFISTADLDLSYRFYPVSDADFGLGINFDVAIPYLFRSWQNGIKTTLRLSNITLLGSYFDFSIGCQYRHIFEKTHGIEWFVGPSLSFYIVNYKVGFDETVQQTLFNMMFGLQGRISYVYYFNRNIAITSGLIFEYDFYSLAQIKYPENYAGYANFLFSPVISAKFSF